MFNETQYGGHCSYVTYHRRWRRERTRNVCRNDSIYTNDPENAYVQQSSNVNTRERLEVDYVMKSERGCARAFNVRARVINDNVWNVNESNVTQLNAGMFFMYEYSTLNKLRIHA